jgi:hypothetical protein
MPVRPAVVLTLSYFAPGDTNVFAGPNKEIMTASGKDTSSIHPAKTTGRRLAINFPFDGAKATRWAAKFLRMEGGTMNVMKMVKLIYIVDRESIRVRGKYFSNVSPHGSLLRNPTNSLRRSEP